MRCLKILGLVGLLIFHGLQIVGQLHNVVTVDAILQFLAGGDDLLMFNDGQEAPMDAEQIGDALPEGGDGALQPAEKADLMEDLQRAHDALEIDVRIYLLFGGQDILP